MKIIKYPAKKDWKQLCKRAILNQNNLQETVQNVLNDVKINQNKALTKYADLFDNVSLTSFEINQQEIEEADKLVSTALKEAIQLAKSNIEIFHNSQKETAKKVVTTAGVTCWRKSVAIEKVGLYIPGGSAPLFSTILMLATPAKIAGCKEIVLCTPPNKEGKVHPAILYTAALVGVTKIFKVGGAQAIGAMAYGTQTIPSVYKILGPGNQYVTKAKELVQQEGIAIDMPAGPSEVLVIADETSNSAFVAADLLSQAEHGADSQAVLVTTSSEIAQNILAEVNKQVKELSRREIAEKALENSFVVVLNSSDEMIDFSNVYAPEHLIIASENASTYIDKISNAGSVFLGNYSCESAGDYASGTNHTLPTNGYAKNYSGVSLDSFIKKITFQQVTKQGIATIGKAIELMAAAEGLQAHKNAVTLRLKDIERN
ncbi:histidinol dehydrogenase [Tenacibaculum finnmarkense genomovar finnmarkense]|uniref:histidinol dehydrogenase n=1 Tax=Tenacibaculum finnmarkense TaxID=2781243 RepID=UPI001E331C18|nr:histidinol dehydrogenase [Tenacibaculum finnmarkense]MCD8418311.1 histidinol dehydrogenase [Tenacibaculum finnmarkense genomovar finnmarkense]MCD8447220.1 histidinol dehydrogenase [Tenacibaculum finnmarkense genomovar finnmarkense]MCG8186656.1 histidinol dehydrogenase [Tenacibaculum finnmarkense genomovar finnmarkense]MCG8203190.1 histidinol dehydrogenase [Tenacibaculum finnmarkense genomovar finnmarkense]MCG8210563.1 histidinol dehydrogenase [Tenacibaculum finnmarkense genomovar finnmarken